MVTNPPDGFPANGSWRHFANDGGEYDSWQLGASTWMSSVLSDAMFSYWLLTGDSRIPALSEGFANWMDINGVTEVPWGDPRPPMPWYWTTSNELVGRTYNYPGGNNIPAGTVTVEASTHDGGDQTPHDMEMIWQFALGYWFGGRTETKYLNRFDEMFAPGMGIRGNDPPRMYNWMLRNTSSFMLFLDPAAPTPQQLRAGATSNLAVTAGGRGEVLLQASPNPFNPATTLLYTVVGAQNFVPLPGVK
jgi:hypothetical protein